MAKKSKTDERVYTYRKGKKIYLKKEPDQFIVRAKPEELEKLGITKNVEQVSASSSRVTVKDRVLESAMENMPKVAVTHHAYSQEDNNAEFLVTDRMMVTFRQPPSNDLLNHLMT